MIISVIDGGWVVRIGYCSVIVNVVDVNDNFLVFFFDEYFFIVLENVLSGIIVIYLNVIDDDFGINVVIVYII